MFTPSQPENKSVAVRTTADRAIDEFHILRHSVETPVDGNPIVGVDWAKGYRDDGGFVFSESFTDTFSGDALAAKMAEQVAQGRTVYDAVKFALWELIAAKHGLEGTVNG